MPFFSTSSAILIDDNHIKVPNVLDIKLNQHLAGFLPVPAVFLLISVFSAISLMFPASLHSAAQAVPCGR